MKNLILLTLLALTLTVAVPVLAQTSLTDSLVQVSQSGGTVVQTQTPAQISPEIPVPIAKVGFFEKIWNKLTDNGIWVIVMYAVGFLSKNGVTKMIKNIAGKGAIITEVSSSILNKAHIFLEDVDKSIKDDGSVDQNSLKEAIEAGKTVAVSTKEGYKVIFQPNKTITTIPAG